MDKVVATLSNLLAREEKLFAFKSATIDISKIPEKIQLGQIYLYCEYIEIRLTLDQLCSDVHRSATELLMYHDFFQIITARIIELLPLVYQMKESLWLTILKKKKWTQDDVNFNLASHQFNKQRMDELIHRNEIIHLINEMEQKARTDLVLADSDPDTEIEQELSLEAAIILIQTFERRRQAMLQGESLRKLRSSSWVNRFRLKSKYSENEAARILQKAFRMFTFRKRFKKARQAELNLLGLGTVITDEHLSTSVKKAVAKDQIHFFVSNQPVNHKIHRKKKISGAEQLNSDKQTLGSTIYHDLKKLLINYTSFKATKKYENICHMTARPQINSIEKHSQLYTMYKDFITANFVLPVKDIHLNNLISQSVEITIKQKHFVADLSTIFKSICLSPLLSTYVSQTTGKVRNVILIGPTGSGKSTFVEAMATSTGSVLFRFTRRNLKINGKAAKILKHNLKMFIKKDLPCIFWFDKVGKSLKPGLKTLIKGWIQKWCKYAKLNEGLLVVATSDVKNVATGLFKMKIEFPTAPEEARFEIIKKCLMEITNSWKLPEDALQLNFVSELTMATKGLQLGSIVNILRSAAHESLKQKLKSTKKPFMLEDFLPKIQSFRFSKKL